MANINVYYSPMRDPRICKEWIFKQSLHKSLRIYDTKSVRKWCLWFHNLKAVYELPTLKTHIPLLCECGRTYCIFVQDSYVLKMAPKLLSSICSDEIAILDAAKEKINAKNTSTSMYDKLENILSS